MDKVKAKQALQEFAWASLWIFIPSVVLYWQGLEVDGKTVWPELSTAGAVLAGLVQSAILGAIKALGWFGTGTKV